MSAMGPRAGDWMRAEVAPCPTAARCPSSLTRHPTRHSDRTGGMRAAWTVAPSAGSEGARKGQRGSSATAATGPAARPPQPPWTGPLPRRSAGAGTIRAQRRCTPPQLDACRVCTGTRDERAYVDDRDRSRRGFPRRPVHPQRHFYEGGVVTSRYAADARGQLHAAGERVHRPTVTRFVRLPPWRTAGRRDRLHAAPMADPRSSARCAIEDRARRDGRQQQRDLRLHGLLVRRRVRGLTPRRSPCRLPRTVRN